jgi:hypothetical protein
MRPLMTVMRRSALGVALVVATTTVAGAAGNPPLNRNLGAYFVFASRTTRLKNFHLLSPCNIGVNCAQPSTQSECGQAIFSEPEAADGSQIAADSVSISQAGGKVWQIFRNKGGPLTGTIIGLPGMQPDGTDLLDPLPILADLDMDGIPSCGPNCTPDYGDIEAACGFPAVFPGCDPGRPILVSSNSDCDPLGEDQNTGNSRCDLAPGAYGILQVLNGGNVTFLGGDYQFCNVAYGKNTNTIANGPTTIDIPAPGSMNINNLSSFGSQCGDFTIRMKGAGTFGLGRNVNLNAFVCAPQATVNLGDSNFLTGQFVGDTVLSNKNNEGRCCGGSCTCVDAFSPTSGMVGDEITLTSNCNLNNATGVKICGIVATINSKNATELKVKIPVGASGACAIEVESVPGVYTVAGTLNVTP